MSVCVCVCVCVRERERGREREREILKLRKIAFLASSPGSTQLRPPPQAPPVSNIEELDGASG